MDEAQGRHWQQPSSVDVRIPVGTFTCVTGVSGSGKSTLINDTFYRLAAMELNGAGEQPAPYESIEGLELFDKVVDIDQSPIGRTPRSNPATYPACSHRCATCTLQVPESRTAGVRAGPFQLQRNAVAAAKPAKATA